MLFKAQPHCYRNLENKKNLNQVVDLLKGLLDNAAAPKRNGGVLTV
jgi:hypothetical protein